MRQFWRLNVAHAFLQGSVVSLCILLGAFDSTRWGVHRVLVVESHPSWRPYTVSDNTGILFPTYRIVALYGEPGEPVLGALGEQPIDASITRVQAIAAQYRPLVRERVLPALEIMASVASNTPMRDSSYSAKTNSHDLASWIQAAKKRGVYVVLDLQPGREDFVAQAKRLEPELRQPNVGLALDPEWRLEPDQVPLAQIGSVSIREVNETAAWLAGMTKQRKLPQKLFLLHEFRTSMLPDRGSLDTSYAQLSYAIQMDGQGIQAEKLNTWQSVIAQPPSGVYFGWKNFYIKDSPMRTPVETMQLTPVPWYVSYQ